jgi:hypothetical protein
MLALDLLVRNPLFFHKAVLHFLLLAHNLPEFYPHQPKLLVIFSSYLL